MRLLSIVALVLLSACAGARAYERGQLAKPRMQIEPDAENVRLQQHVFETREGSMGGYGAGGGGCGCN